MLPDRIEVFQYGVKVFVAVRNVENKYNIVAGKQVIRRDLGPDKVKNAIKSCGGKFKVKTANEKISSAEVLGVLVDCGDYRKDIQWIAERFNVSVPKIRAKIMAMVRQGYELPYNIRGCQR